VHDREERFIAGTTARQVGKTVTGSMEIDMGMSEPMDIFGAPMVGVLAPTYEKAELMVNMYITRLTETFGSDCYRMNQNKHILTIVDGEAGTLGARLQWLSSDDPYSVVGYTFSKLIVDESQAVPDEVFNKIRPALDVRDATVRAFGTPDITPTQSWFKGMWLRGQDSKESNYHSYTVSCFDNPWMKMETILEARSQIPEREFRMLYLGEWVDEEGQFFVNYVNAMVDSTPPYRPDYQYVMGLDLAIHDDFNVVIIADRATRTCLFKERWNNTDPTITYERIASIWERFGKPKIIADESGMGEPMIAELRRMGLKVRGIKFTVASKMPIMKQLQADLEHRRIMFPKDWDDVIRELKSYLYRSTPSGRLTAEAASGFHDDCITALALLNEGVRSDRTSGSGAYSYIQSDNPLERMGISVG
jgi:hypothetical protein